MNCLKLRHKLPNSSLILPRDRKTQLNSLILKGIFGGWKKIVAPTCSGRDASFFDGIGDSNSHLPHGSAIDPEAGCSLLGERPV